MIINFSYFKFLFHTHVIQSMTARCCIIKQSIYLYLSIYPSVRPSVRPSLARSEYSRVKASTRSDSLLAGVSNWSG